MNREQSRGPWYLLTGVILGLTIGIIYTHFFQPVRYIDTSPSSLKLEYKERYRSLIAAAYLSNGDLIRANARLDLLQDKDKFRALTEQAQRTLAQDGSSSEAHALGLLAIALGQEPPGPGQAITQQPKQPTSAATLSTPVEINLSSPQTLDPDQLLSKTLAPTFETPNASFGSPTSAVIPDTFVLSNNNELCDQEHSEPLIEIEIIDRSGQPLPGVLVVVSWAGGEERFYTGLKPEKGLGYADYTLTPGFVYSLRIGENGIPLGNIEPVACTSTDGATYWGVISLKFAQP